MALAGDTLAAAVSRPFRPLTRVVLALLLLLSATTVAQVAVFGPREQQAERADQLLHTAEQAMVDQETGVRGFLLSEAPYDRDFLDPYLVGVRAEADSSRALAQLPAGPGLRRALQERAAAAQHWQSQWAELAVADPADKPSSEQMFLRRGRELFDAYRTADARVAASLAGRSAHVRAWQRGVSLAGGAAGLLVVLVALVAVRTTRRRLLGAVADPLARLAAVVRAGPGTPVPGAVRDASVRELRVLAGDVAELFGALQRQDAATRAHAGELEAIAEAGRSLLTDGDPRSAVCRAVAGLTGAQHVALFEPDGQGRLVTTGAVGTAPGEIVLPLSGDGLTAQVYRTGTKALVDDARSDRRIAQGVVDPLGVVASAFLPVLAAGTSPGTCLGVLVVALPRPLGELSQTLLGALEVLAGEAAVAIDRADLLAQLADRARTDGLTGIANRRTWEEELPRELARAARSGQPVCVAVLDLDHFKAFNDAYGHPAGDELLRTAARRWSAELRGTDLLARYGGEEFSVVLPDCDLGAAVRLLDVLRGQLPGRQTCSVGVTVWDGEEGAEAVVARADAALYRAKHEGRDRVHAVPAALPAALPAVVPAGAPAAAPAPAPAALRARAG